VPGGFAGTMAPGDAKAGPVTDIEGAEDADDSERRGVEDVDGSAGADDLDGSTGANDVVSVAGRGGHGRRSRFWCSTGGNTVPRWGVVAQKP